MKTITITDITGAETLYRNFSRLEDTNFGEFSFLLLYFDGGQQTYLQLDRVGKIEIAEEVDAG